MAAGYGLNRLNVTKIDVIILAGAPNKGPLAEVCEAPWEALINVNGKPMVEYVIDTILQLNNLNKVVLVGPEEFSEIKPGIIFAPCKDSLVANLKTGVEALGTDKAPYILVVTSDIPLITVEAIEDFLKQCMAQKAQLFYPIVSKEINEKLYPTVQRTYFTLKEGTFTGGNIMLFEPGILEERYDYVEQLVMLRKKPAQIIKMLGFKFIYKFLRKNLSLKEIEERAEKILGLKGKAIMSDYPEIGIDVDKPSDLELMESLFAKR